MTVLVVALGSAGDVHPNVGLALALKRRGHRVVLVTSVAFASLAQRTGLEMRGLGTEPEFQDALRDPDLWHPHRAFSVVCRRLILPPLREVYRIIEGYSQDGDTIVTSTAMAFGARIAHEKLGVPLVTVHLQPIMLRSVCSPPVFGFPHIIGHLPHPLDGRQPQLGAERIHAGPEQAADEVAVHRPQVGSPERCRLCSATGAGNPQRRARARAP